MGRIYENWTRLTFLSTSFHYPDVNDGKVADFDTCSLAWRERSKGMLTMMPSSTQALSDALKKKNIILNSSTYASYKWQERMMNCLGRCKIWKRGTIHPIPPTSSRQGNLQLGVVNGRLDVLYAEVEFLSYQRDLLERHQ